MHSKKYFIANWKMNGLKKDLIQISNIENFFKKKINFHNLLCVFCLPYTILGLVVTKLKLRKIKIGAQDVSSKSSNHGAYTGQISSKMLKDLNCKFTIIGHSENRQIGETDNDISIKIGLAVENNLTVILCIGENLKEYKNNQSFSKVKRQLYLNLKKNKKYLNKVIIAYEPIWSIGTGIIPQTDYLNEIFYKIKKYLKKEFNADAILLYGGSVSSKNMHQLKNIHLCDGFLIGGASLKSKNFIDIIKKYYS